MITIRPERPEDQAAVFAVNQSAFPTPAEARLVDTLRPVARPIVSLVATLDDEVVGHILFAPVTVRGDAGTWAAMGLAPMAVHPNHQNRGIGSQLVRAGLEACRRLGQEVVFVLGHLGYYPRFGFEPAPPKGLTYKGQVDPHFMVIELRPGALGGMAGAVEFHPEFDRV